MLDVIMISPRYALIMTQIPLPVGGTHQEIVTLDTILEIKEK